MTRNESRNLRRLVDTFDARALGDGDEATGVNVLAAMAIALANLARPGSGIRTPDWRTIPVGCNLIATGPRTATMALDEVVAPVARCQDNLLAQLARLLKDDKAEEDRKLRSLPRRWGLSSGPPPSTGETSLLQLMAGSAEEESLIGSDEDEWVEVVGSAPGECLGDLIRRPRAFIAAATPALLEQQLAGAHQGQALVTIGLNREADAARFGDLCPALIDGLVPAGPSGETVRGRLLVTDPGRLLSKAATADGDRTAWLARLLWLTEGSAGPDLPSDADGEGVVRLPNLTARFEYAVQLIFARRLNSRKPEPVIDECDFAGRQARWMRFLAGMEMSLPGISGTARLLPASLSFGLRRLVRASPPPEDFIYYMEGIEALARHLIRRMANARTAILFSAEQAWKLRYKHRILARLTEGSLDNRSIYHPLHLSASLCGELLSDLEADRRVRRCGNKWERIEDATPPGDPPHRAPLEV